MKVLGTGPHPDPPLESGGTSAIEADPDSGFKERLDGVEPHPDSGARHWMADPQKNFATQAG
jgi:hypothetical protein